MAHTEPCKVGAAKTLQNIQKSSHNGKNWHQTLATKCHFIKTTPNILLPTLSYNPCNQTNHPTLCCIEPHGSLGDYFDNHLKNVSSKCLCYKPMYIILAMPCLQVVEWKFTICGYGLIMVMVNPLAINNGGSSLEVVVCVHLTIE